MQARKGIRWIHCFSITLSEYLDLLRRRRLAVAIDARCYARLAEAQRIRSLLTHDRALMETASKTGPRTEPW
jgi:hypothetical protein